MNTLPHPPEPPHENHVLLSPELHSEHGMLWVTATQLTDKIGATRLRVEPMIIFPRTPLELLQPHATGAPAERASEVLENILRRFPQFRGQVQDLLLRHREPRRKIPAHEETQAHGPLQIEELSPDPSPYSSALHPSGGT